MKKVKSEKVELETKEIILEVATELFGSKGFDGTSIREIARIAKVNIAAINYHFLNKQNLHLEVLKNGFTTMEAKIQELALKNHKNTPEFCIAIYLKLIEHGCRLNNMFKVFLDNAPIAGELVQNDRMIGPPGAEFILMHLEKDVKKKLSIQDKEWAVRVIFTYLVHTALLASTNYGRKQCQDLMDQKQINLSIKRLVRAVILEVES